MESNRNSPGGRIATLRKNAGLKQRELAEKISVSRELVNLWENDLRQIKGEDIVRLADALGTTCDYLLRGVSTENLDIHTAIGLTDDGIRAIQEIPPDLKTAFCETVKSEKFQALLKAISDSARYATRRGDPIITHLRELLQGMENPLPAYDMDIVFRYQASEAAGKLFDEVSTLLYNEREGHLYGQHQKRD